MSSLRGIKCLVTAGPTYEAIDPVRFIGNRSSGKMGIAIADDLTKRGAEVVLILGPSSEKIPTQIAKVVRIESADDMYHAVMSEIKTVRLGIFSAAVADYKPKVMAQEKIKKAGEELSIDLIKTVDILGGKLPVSSCSRSGSELANSGSTDPVMRWPADCSSLRKNVSSATAFFSFLRMSCSNRTSPSKLPM